MRFLVLGSTIVTCLPPCLTITSMLGSSDSMTSSPVSVWMRYVTRARDPAPTASMARAAAIGSQGRRGRGPGAACPMLGFSIPHRRCERGEVASGWRFGSQPAGRRRSCRGGGRRMVDASRWRCVAARRGRPGRRRTGPAPGRPRPASGTAGPGPWPSSARRPGPAPAARRLRISASGRGVFSLCASSFWIRLPSGNGGRPARRK